MPKYTCAGLIREIKRRCNDEEYPNEDILTYLNDAQCEVLGEDKYPFLEKIFEYEEIGRGELTLPLDFQVVVQLFVGKSEMEYVPYKQYFASSHSEEYTTFSDRLYIHSSNPERPQSVKLFYIAKPRLMQSEDDEPYIPYEFKEILVLGALLRIERADGNYDYAAVLQQQQDELVQNMKLRYCVRQQAMQSRSRLPLRHIGS